MCTSNTPCFYQVLLASPRSSMLEGNSLKSLKTLTCTRVAEVLLEKGREMH